MIGNPLLEVTTIVGPDEHGMSKPILYNKKRYENQFHTCKINFKKEKVTATCICGKRFQTKSNTKKFYYRISLWFPSMCQREFGPPTA